MLAIPGARHGRGTFAPDGDVIGLRRSIEEAPPSDLRTASHEPFFI
jgi:hypothetical protein